MNLKDRQKICPQCDGRISLDADLCPYCATDQSKVLVSSNHHQSLQNSLTTPYAPLYTAKTLKPVNEPMVERKINTTMGAPTIPSAPETVSKESKGIFTPILLLSLAGNILTIGLLQLLFSDRGFLRLEWDSSYWFLYCLAALPLFYLGYKKASSLKE